MKENFGVMFCSMLSLTLYTSVIPVMFLSFDSRVSVLSRSKRFPMSDSNEIEVVEDGGTGTTAGTIGEDADDNNEDDDVVIDEVKASDVDVVGGADVSGGVSIDDVDEGSTSGLIEML